MINEENKYVYDEMDCLCNEDFVKCPYCGFEDYDVYDGLDIDANIYDCPDCGKTFGFKAVQTISFTSFPLKKEIKI